LVSKRAKDRLREDANPHLAWAFDAAPMGYLLCGPVGTGESRFSLMLSGSIGIPCVKLRNFRSKFVGETEGNLEHVSHVFAPYSGPVVVDY